MRKVLIAGATSAIAQETAKRFAAAGDRLFLVARNADRLQRIAADLAVRGAAVAGTLVCDLNDTALHADLVSQAIQRLDGLDTALVAYGVLGDQRQAQLDPTASELVMRTNFLSVVSLLAPIANYMEQQRRGTIAVISSVAGDRGRQSNYVYGAAKGGLNIFLEGLRNRLHPAGVRVLTVKPGFVDTPMTAHLPKNALFASPAAVAQGICRAIARGRDVVYLPFYWRFIMLAIRLMPEAIFKRLRL